MTLVFRDHDRKNGIVFTTGMSDEASYSNFAIIAFFVLQLIILVFLGLSIAKGLKYAIAGSAHISLLWLVFQYFAAEHNRRWIAETWDLAKKIMPYLFVGIFAAGAIGEILPETFVTATVGGNSVLANFIASLSGARMYFATLFVVAGWAWGNFPLGVS